jgi:hypothetical protein
MMIQSNFKEWTLDKIDEAFGLRQVFQMDLLNEVLSFDYTIQDFERLYLEKLQSLFLLGGDEWKFLIFSEPSKALIIKSKN